MAKRTPQNIIKTHVSICIFIFITYVCTLYGGQFSPLIPPAATPVWPASTACSNTMKNLSSEDQGKAKNCLRPRQQNIRKQVGGLRNVQLIVLYVSLPMMNGRCQCKIWSFQLEFIRGDHVLSLNKRCQRRRHGCTSADLAFMCMVSKTSEYVCPRPILCRVWNRGRMFIIMERYVNAHCSRGFTLCGMSDGLIWLVT